MNIEAYYLIMLNFGGTIYQLQCDIEGSIEDFRTFLKANRIKELSLLEYKYFSVGTISVLMIISTMEQYSINKLIEIFETKVNK